MTMYEKNMKADAQQARERNSARRIIGSAAVAGCLALAMLPGVALAQPATQGNGANDAATGSSMQAPQMPGASFGEQGSNGFGPSASTQPAPFGNANGTEAQGFAPAGTEFSGTSAGNAAPGGEAASGAVPDGTAPTGTAPTGTAPTGTAPTGTAPTGTAPANSEAPQAPNAAGSGNQNAPVGSLPGDAQQAGTANGPQAPTNSSSANGQAPAAPNAAPMGQAPMGNAGTIAPMPGGELDDRIINAIDDEAVKAKALEGNKDTQNLRPAIPEGQVNIQQLIDTIRDAFVETFKPEAQQPANDTTMQKGAPSGMAPSAPAGSTMAPDALQAMPARFQAPAPEAAGAQSADNGVLPVLSQSAQAPKGPDAAAPSGDDTSALDIFKQIVEKVLSVLRGL